MSGLLESGMVGNAGLVVVQCHKHRAQVLFCLFVCLLQRVCYYIAGLGLGSAAEAAATDQVLSLCFLCTYVRI